MPPPPLPALSPLLTVARFLETADPLTQMGIRTFYSMHDNLVKAPIYRFAVDGTAGTLNFAASTTAYK